jgi:LmbE family N-acetylglucosaminyl deacetylase
MIEQGLSARGSRRWPPCVTPPHRLHIISKPRDALVRTVPSMQATTGTLLGVWAHPDDEAYLSAGLMADASRRGDRVVVLTVTAGEMGTNDPARWPPERLAARRRRELRASLDALGVHEHHQLGYPDGECDRFDATAEIAGVIDRVRPDTIVTFGPEGMTGHPDHRAVSAWTTVAWRAANHGSSLWYATLTPAFHERWSDLNEQIGLWSSIDRPPCTEPDRLAHLLTLDGETLDRKLAALRAHASQTDVLVDLVGAATFRDWWRTEAFVDASALPLPAPLLGATT